MFDCIGIDWGSKRFGMAFGASINGLVLACNYECDTEVIWEILDKEIKARQTKFAIIGMPTGFNFQKTQVSLRIEEFVEQFKIKYPFIQIELTNERNSTKKALLKDNLLKTFL